MLAPSAGGPSGSAAATPLPSGRGAVMPTVYAVIDSEPYEYPSTSTSALVPVAPATPAT